MLVTRTILIIAASNHVKARRRGRGDTPSGPPTRTPGCSAGIAWSGSIGCDAWGVVVTGSIG